MTHRNVIAEILGHDDVAPPFVRIIVMETDGSTPREVSASMIVGQFSTAGTIGGGQLEYEAIAHARMLLDHETTEWLRDVRLWPLGPALGQCCGGAVRVLFERYGVHEIDTLSAVPSLAGNGAVAIHPGATGAPLLICSNRQEARKLPMPVAGCVSDILSGVRRAQSCLIRQRDGTTYFIEPIAMPRTSLFIWGAGHVGQAIVKIASDLAFDVHWIDTHEERFGGQQFANVDQIVARDPAIIASAAPAGAFHVVLTYSHAIDLAICHALLTKPTFGFLGLIGSQTKRVRFLKRLRDAGVSEAAVSRLTCPIGIGAFTGKEPATIAVAVAAQLLEQHEQLTESGQTDIGEKHGAVQPVRA